MVRISMSTAFVLKHYYGRGYTTIGYPGSPNFPKDKSIFRDSIEPTISEDSRVRCCTDISKITRKPSKTGKHGHEKRKSTKEARDAKPKPGKDDNSSDQQQNGRVNYVKSSTLIGSLKPHGLKEAQEKRGFSLIALTKEAHMSLSRIAKLAIRVSSFVIQGLLLTLK
ncbi:hypothetical protein Tco_0642112 [Tanacetum coccineum]